MNENTEMKKGGKVGLFRLWFQMSNFNFIFLFLIIAPIVPIYQNLRMLCYHQGLRDVGKSGSGVFWLTVP